MMDSVTIPGEIFTRRDISSDAKIVWAYLWRWRPDLGGACSASVCVIATRLGMSPERTRRALYQLSKKGLTHEKRQPGSTTLRHALRPPAAS